MANTPAGSIAATTAQAAINELDTEKMPYTGGTFTGAIQVPAGSVSAPSIKINDTDTGIWAVAADKINYSLAGVELARMTATGLGLGIGGAFDPSVLLHLKATTGNAQITVESNSVAALFLIRQSADATQPTINYRKGRGSLASPAYPNQNDIIGGSAFQAYDGTTPRNVARFTAAVIAATPGATDMQGRFVLDVTPASSVTVTEIMRWEYDTGISMYGANPVIDQNRIHVHRSYTVGTLPSAAVASKEIYVSNEAGGAVLAFSDGTNWRRVTDRAIVT